MSPTFLWKIPFSRGELAFAAPALGPQITLFPFNTGFVVFFRKTENMFGNRSNWKNNQEIAKMFLKKAAGAAISIKGRSVLWGVWGYLLGETGLRIWISGCCRRGTDPFSEPPIDFLRAKWALLGHKD